MRLHLTRRTRRLVVVGALLMLVVGAVVIVASVGMAADEQPSSSPGGLPPKTAQVAKATLTQTEQLTGTLSYGASQPLIAQGTSGVITSIAAPGAVIKQGEPVFAVDGDPVLLISGTIPPYRTLKQGAEGPDVLQLETTMQAMGFTGLTVDDKFDWATAKAVKDWQKFIGLEATGSFTVEDIVVAEGEIRIASQELPVGTHLGAAGGVAIVTYTGTTKVATIPLDVNDQDLVAAGNTATITLPDGSEVGGVVADVGKVATTTEEGDDVVTVTVTIDDQQAVSAFDAAPVTLELVTAQHADVLVVPITALVALAGGGYGVEVVDGTTVTYVAVEPGMFAGGMVEISGSGIAEGMTVGVAA